MTSRYGPVSDRAADHDHAGPEYDPDAHQISADLRQAGGPIAHSEARLALSIAIDESVERFPRFEPSGGERWRLGQIGGSRELPTRVPTTA